MGHLVADDAADRPVVDRRVGARVEEGRLKDRGRNGDGVLRGVVGGVEDHPVGGTPVFAIKSHEPPVGVDGAVADCWKINHSK